jgi:hypothetical protein
MGLPVLSCGFCHAAITAAEAPVFFHHEGTKVTKVTKKSHINVYNINSLGVSFFGLSSSFVPSW